MRPDILALPCLTNFIKEIISPKKRMIIYANMSFKAAIASSILLAAFSRLEASKNE